MTNSTAGFSRDNRQWVNIVFADRFVDIQFLLTINININ